MPRSQKKNDQACHKDIYMPDFKQADHRSHTRYRYIF